MTAEQRILIQADKAFKTYGVNSVTMDDIAKGLGISKKTIYQYFPNKASIVYEVTKLMIEEEQKEQILFAETAENAVEELANVIKHSMQMFKSIPPKLVYEVRKYYPKAWHLCDSYQTDFLRGMMEKNLHKGISEGYFRKDIDVEIVARMRMSQIEAGFNESLFPSKTFNVWEVQVQMFWLYMYGIVTEKGRALLDKYLQKEN